MKIKTICANTNSYTGYGPAVANSVIIKYLIEKRLLVVIFPCLNVVPVAFQGSKNDQGRKR